MRLGENYFSLNIMQTYKGDLIILQNYVWLKHQAISKVHVNKEKLEYGLLKITLVYSSKTMTVFYVKLVNMVYITKTV